jgi:outer membrane protease
VPRTISITSLLIGCARLGLALAVSLLTAAPARAADWAYAPFDAPPATYTGDVGVRFWYGKSSTAKNLYDNTGSLLVSRLTYDGLSIFAAEAYGRFDLNRRWFLKGYVGGGSLRNGNLKDEDFPPVVAPYSATWSAQENGSPIYASVDVGFNAFYGPDFRIGLFGGLHYMNETVSAFGCTQAAFNPLICGLFPVPGPVKVITQDNSWYSARFGLDGSFEIGRFRFSAEAAWLPSVWLYGSDAHWLRIGNFIGGFTSPVLEDGKGWGYQLEGFVSYRVTPALSLGIGGRYWHMQTHGLTHFENHVVGIAALPQPVDWKVDNFGMFLQMSLKFGPYPVIEVH